LTDRCGPSTIYLPELADHAAEARAKLEARRQALPTEGSHPGLWDDLPKASAHFKSCCTQLAHHELCLVWLEYVMTAKGGNLEQQSAAGDNFLAALRKSPTLLGELSALVGKFQETVTTLVQATAAVENKALSSRVGTTSPAPAHSNSNSSLSSAWPSGAGSDAAAGSGPWVGRSAANPGSQPAALAASAASAEVRSEAAVGGFVQHLITHWSNLEYTGGVSADQLQQWFDKVLQLRMKLLSIIKAWVTPENCTVERFALLQDIAKLSSALKGAIQGPCVQYNGDMHPKLADDMGTPSTSIVFNHMKSAIWYSLMKPCNRREKMCTSAQQLVQAVAEASGDVVVAQVRSIETLNLD
jgi:hypothetical protein